MLSAQSESGVNREGGNRDSSRALRALLGSSEGRHLRAQSNLEWEGSVRKRNMWTRAWAYSSCTLVHFNHTVVSVLGTWTVLFHPLTPEAGGDLIWKMIHKKLWGILVCVLRTCWEVCNTCHLAFSESPCIQVLIKELVSVWFVVIHESSSSWRHSFHNYLIQC